MRIFLTGIELNKRDFIVLTIFFFLLFAWYNIFSYYVLKFIVEESTRAFSICYAFFYFFISLSMILSSSFVSRFDKTSVIYASSIISSVGTIFIALIPIIMVKIAIYFVLGAIFGIGLLAFLTYFWDLTVREERGRVSGLMGLIFLPLFPFFIFLADNLDFFRIVVLCILFNSGTMTIKSLNPKKTSMITRKKDLESFNKEKRTILLYIIPWIIYSLINATLAKTISFRVSQYLSSSLPMLVAVQIIGGGLGAIMGGVIADFFGRRTSLTLGLTLYGISSAISGLAKSHGLFYISHIGIGLTWGTFLTLYTFLIWGDLSTLKTCTRRYSTGLAIYYSAMGIGVLFSSILFQIPLIIASIISCFLIFISNIPVILAPELMPLDFREKIRLKLYIRLIKRKKLKQ